MSMKRGLVSCEWLQAELGRTDAEPLVVVDATWYLPNSPFAAPEGSGGAQSEFENGPRIPGSVFFDIDAVSSPHPTSPHMLPSEETFVAAMAALGIEPSSRVVAYDRLGIFSAPRLWYMLKVAFGHPGEVAVIDGGLPRWLELSYPVEKEDLLPRPPAEMATWRRDPAASWDIEQVRKNIEARDNEFIDVRPAARFSGAAAEPRAGMRGGHIPGSRNVPFLSMLTEGPVRRMKPEAELSEAFKAAGVTVESLAEKPEGARIVTSCGSGLTACIVGLSMHQLGLPLSRFAVYDGSWSEWGAQKDTPIVRGAPGETEEVVP